jgi:hypothetical protein
MFVLTSQDSNLGISRLMRMIEMNEDKLACIRFED